MVPPSETIARGRLCLLPASVVKHRCRISVGEVNLWPR